MPARKQVVRLMALWGDACPVKDVGESRDGRLHYIAAVVGHPVGSANDLTAAEIAQVTLSLEHDLSAKAPASSTPASLAGKVLRFPNRAGISKRQLWKIRQIEIWLGWHSVPARLEGWLDSLFKARRPEHLTHAQGWRAIEGLTSLAARERVKASRGAEYMVGRNELAAERDRLKGELLAWRPPELANF